MIAGVQYSHYTGSDSQSVCDYIWLAIDDIKKKGFQAAIDHLGYAVLHAQSIIKTIVELDGINGFCVADQTSKSSLVSSLMVAKDQIRNAILDGVIDSGDVITRLNGCQKELTNIRVILANHDNANNMI